MSDPARFHPSLTLDGRHAMDGWWESEATARRKFASTVGDYGRDGARIVLTDTVTGATLTTWPEET